MSDKTPRAIVIGGGPAGLMAAQTMAQAGLSVSVYDHMPTLGRKFLLAGRGGLNLTHSENIAAFLQRYDVPDWMAPHIAAFPPLALRQWAEDLGEPTFAGTSGRIFPKSFKASPLLRAWLRRLAASGVTFFPRHKFVGLKPDGGVAMLDAAGAEIHISPDAIVLAMGGASWGRLGSDGAWAPALQDAGMATVPFLPANCGFEVAWSAHFQARFAGAVLKTVKLSHHHTAQRGSLTLTSTGIEGGIVYGMARMIRQEILANGSARVEIDLRPDTSIAELTERLASPRGKTSLSTFLRKSVGLDPAAIGLLQEIAHASGIPLPNHPKALASRIKALPLVLQGVAGIERAISSAGGLARSECDENLMLKRWPGIFCAGEMLDWEAPTGGYLLQACFSTGFVAGRAAANWTRRLV